VLTNKLKSIKELPVANQCKINPNDVADDKERKKRLPFVFDDISLLFSHQTMYFERRKLKVFGLNHVTFSRL
jgi:hypothetical protein